MKKKKICLACPPSIFLLDEKVFPFLGILIAAASFERQGYVVDVMDLGGVQNYMQVVEDYLDANKNDLHFFGLTATTPQIPACFQIAQTIKNKYPEVKLVLGGAHGTLTHTATKAETVRGVFDGRARKNLESLTKVFDVLVCGDGELTLESILNTQKGIIDVDDKFSPLFIQKNMMDDMPNPARHLIDLNSYSYFIEGKRATSIISQRGCSMGCSFCSGRKSPYLRMARNRSSHSVVDELEFLYKEYGYEAAMIYDDELNLVHKNCIKLMNDISDLQDKLGVDFRLRGFIKAELFNEEQAKAMYRSGFRWILSGFESGDPRILENIQKNATREDNEKVIELSKKYNMKTKALMSLGHNGESPETAENTKNWLLSTKPDDFDITVITSMPGSPIYDDAVRLSNDVFVHESKAYGDKLYQKELDFTKEADFYKGIPGEYVSYVWTDHLSAKELVETRDALESEVRSKLNIPFNPSNEAVKYEHSMGQGNVLPDWILRSSENFKEPKIEIPEVKVDKRKLSVVV